MDLGVQMIANVNGAVESCLARTKGVGRREREREIGRKRREVKKIAPLVCCVIQRSGFLHGGKKHRRERTNVLVGT